MAAKQASPTPQRIMELMWGFAPPLILEAAVRHHLFDLLDDGPKTLEELARKTRASRRGLAGVLNALVGLKLLGRSGEKYTLAPESAAFLVSHKRGFQGAILKHISKQLLPNWLHLTDVVKSGAPAVAVNREGPGAKFFAEFVEDIFAMSAAPAAALADGLLAKVKKPYSVLDIAAGSGVWGISLAKRSPQVTVTAVDWPSVIPVTRRVARKHGVVNRFKFVKGDLQAANFGKGHQLATLGHILHSEGAARSKKLLQKVRHALAPGGTIAIAEFTPDADRMGPPMPLIFAVNMLVNTDLGDTFTFDEVSGWLVEAGFTNIRQFAAHGPSPLILADTPKA